MLCRQFGSGRSGSRWVGGAMAGIPSGVRNGAEAGGASHAGSGGRAAPAGGAPLIAPSSVSWGRSGRRRGRRGKRSATGVSIPSMWHKGRRMRPACGACASSAASSGSPSRLSTCARPSRVSSAGASLSSQPDPRGNCTAAARRRARDAAVLRPRTENRPASTAAAREANPREQPPQPDPRLKRERGRVPALRQADREPPAQQVDGGGEAGGKARCGERGGHERSKNTTGTRMSSNVFSRQGWSGPLASSRAFLRDDISTMTCRRDGCLFPALRL